jgi:adenylate cyclase
VPTHFNKYGAEENKTALTFFRRAIELDPNFSPGHHGYALALQWDIWHYSSRPYSDVQGVPLEEARIAVSLDDKDAMAHAVLGHMRMWCGEWQAAIAQARTAFALNPNSAFVISMLGCVLGLEGYREEALVRLQQAMRASPHDPLIWLWTMWTAMMQFYSRQFDTATKALQELLRLRPDFIQGQVTLAASLAHSGRIDEAREVSNAPAPMGKTLGMRNRPGPALRTLALRLEGIRIAEVPE